MSSEEIREDSGGGTGGERGRAGAASRDELTALLHDANPAVLRRALENPELDEMQLCVMLERKELPAEILEEIGTRKSLLKSYRVKRALALHPRVPRLVGLRLLRDLYLMDLVRLALSPACSAELRRNAEEQVLARLPQLPLGQKITLARRGPARVAGALLTEGHAQVLPIVLENPFLAEAQVLKALSRERLLPQVAQAIIHHQKWSHSYNVRLALVRNRSAPLATVLAYLPELTVSDLRELAAPGVVPSNLRRYLEAEIAKRVRAR